MNVIYPSMGVRLEWVVVGASPPSLPAGWRSASTMLGARADAVVLDWSAAQMIAPGVKPRPHAVVLATGPSLRGDFPALVIVTASYAKAERPVGLAMIETDGSHIGDAIVVARCAGLTLDTVAVESRVLAAYVRNEGVATAEIIEALKASADKAARTTLPRE